MIVPVEHVVILSLIIFSIGILGVLIRKNAIIMIHPGKSDSTLEERDSFNKGREIEENFLLQDSFLELLNNQNIILGKYHLKEVL